MELNGYSLRRLLKITRVPPTEAFAIASRGDTCRARQRTTNAFFPGPPRPDPEAWQ